MVVYKMMNKSREMVKKLNLLVKKLKVIENKSFYNKEDIYFLNNLIYKFNLVKKYQINSDNKVRNIEDSVYLSISDLANILSLILIRKTGDEAQKRNAEKMLDI